MGPANGTTTANNLTGARAENGGVVSFNNTFINTLGGAAGLNNIGIEVTGPGSQVNMQGGGISTASRASYGVIAQNGGSVTLNGTQINTTGAGSATIAG